MDFEKDIERGDVSDEKTVNNEKRAGFESVQSSPTLTQGTTFESNTDDKGMLEFQCSTECVLKREQGRIQPRDPRAGRRG
jgi:hypothetical protein